MLNFPHQIYEEFEGNLAFETGVLAFLLVDGIAPWNVDGNVVILSFFPETHCIVRLAFDAQMPQPSMSQVDSQSLSLTAS